MTPPDDSVLTRREQVSRSIASALAVGGLASLAYAAIGVRRDGWLAARWWSLAWNGFERHLHGERPLLVALACALVGALLLPLERGLAGRPRIARALSLLLLSAAGFLAATGHLVAETKVTPTFAGAAGKLGNVAAALAMAGSALACRWLAGRRAGVLVALLIAAAPIALGLRGGAIVPKQGGPPTIVLLSVDTLRADRVGAYGCARDTTASIDALARRSVRFADASSPYPFTLTAHSSMLTGLRPLAHGAVPAGPRVDQRLPMFADVPTIAEALRAAGYVTVGVVDDCLWMQPQYGLGRGFDLWRVIPGELPDKSREVAEILADLRGRPAFLFIHCFDVHSDYRQLPYECAPEDRGVYSGWYHGTYDGTAPAPDAPDRFRRHAAGLLRAWNDCGSEVPADVVRYVSDLYDEGVRSADRELGRLFARLDEAGLREQGALLLTADHGEEFREHGRFMHDAQLYRESVQVPLLLRLPHEARAGQVVLAPVSLIDVAPTIAALAGVPFPGEHGRSLLGLLEDESLDPRAVHLGAVEGEDGIRVGAMKLLRRGDEVKLFQVDEDPGETHDLAAVHPEIVRSLLERLDHLKELDLQSAAGRARPGGFSVDAADAARMRAIGYR